ncbi:heme-degrading domain-containing protein [Martelella alba]|uniref:Heme-degrading domain-containing protein n=1 Tax=Martelella alba TaxID=2590451 RepID=A0ABY2SES7_9HYPH|nr:heme-degrading domain-containing protein [Martelella alba]TKI03008.1 heme-degrading domain-containing protein [Martelella alba]
MTHALTLAELLEQEQDNRFDTLDFAGAWEIGKTIHDRAVHECAPVSIEIYAYGHELFVSVLPGATLDNVVWMRRKRNTVLRLGHSSLYAGLDYAAKGVPMSEQNFINQAEYCDHGGSFPLLLKHGAVIGAVSVSGLPSQDDHALVLWGIHNYLTQQH